MKTISVCVIMRNEEMVLERCLRGAALFADEIIVVDTGSTDCSKEIARRYTGKVYDFQWTDDFAAARNAAFEKATCDYIMWLDADDLVDKQNADKISALKHRLFAENAVTMLYERPENGGAFEYLRMVKRRQDGAYWEGIVHERLKGDEPVLHSDAVILHAKQTLPCYQRNIKLMEKLKADALQCDFWLCSQCYLDCSLAGEDQKADSYCALLQQNEMNFSEKAVTYHLIGYVLSHHRLDTRVMQWAWLAWQDYNGVKLADSFSKEVLCTLLFFAVKSAKRRGDTEQADRFNSRILDINPENAAARLNCIWFRQRKGS